MRINPDSRNNPPGSARPCSLPRLLLVLLYDAIIVLALLMVAGTIALELPFPHQTAGKDPAYTIYLLLAWFLYPAWCWRHGGMTLGMRAWKVRLVNSRGDDPGQPPHWWQCGVRFAGAWVSALAAGLGYLWMLIDREKRSWHDLLSQTSLVHSRPAGQKQTSDRSPEEVDGSHPE